MVAIDLSGAAPPSEQIYQQLRGMILTGRLAPGERLPTVRQLARDLGVAPGTAARAYKQLEAESFVQTRARGGTTVIASPQSLPPDFLIAARSLHDAALRHGISLEDSIATLNGLWGSDQTAKDDTLNA
ncbi:GntR family transcriptional regulator [Mycetocola zhadangensis]|uniref:GntR family transcriptional regulator n=1 Tax=Mycetocola zhadangensis TaxID=1164595 RepID=A0A3L7IUQ6_9MICO|nr:GntR family transcriptional regulator [Mycetocola zhadangensis]RLQ81111.1 GntR family transcriptional regulator [Mycetocola zhadangensis]GGF04886.1 GntR family transcriptional regulator [Mycetocola zhadangensis]